MTSWLASLDTKYSGTLDVKAIGSSSCQINRGSASKYSSGVTTTSRWIAPMWAAAARANGSSLASGSAKPTENVRSGSGDAFAAGFLSATLRELPVAERLRHGHLWAAVALT